MDGQEERMPNGMTIRKAMKWMCNNVGQDINWIGISKDEKCKGMQTGCRMD